MQRTIYIGAGSNLGRRRQNILRGADLMDSAGIQIIRCSSLWETQPVGSTSQPDYLNCVFEAACALEPEELLQLTSGIEWQLGRSPGGRWQARHLDLDILYIDHLIIRTASLTVPHPRVSLRRFVLVPLVEIAPDHRDPLQLVNARDLLRDCPDTSWVRCFGPLGEESGGGQQPNSRSVI